MKGSILQNQPTFPPLKEESFYFLLVSCSHAANKVDKWTGEFLLTEVCLNEETPMWLLRKLSEDACAQKF